MSKWGSVDYKDLKELAEKIDRYVENNSLLEDAAKEITARLLAKVVPRTPVGQYPASSGRKGGTLRRGWTVKTHKEAESGKNVSVTSYVKDLSVNEGDGYVEIDIINPVEYAKLVEQGHRTANRKGWVAGRHMLRVSVEEIKQSTPKILEKKIKKELQEVFK